MVRWCGGGVEIRKILSHGVIHGGAGHGVIHGGAGHGVIQGGAGHGRSFVLRRVRSSRVVCVMVSSRVVRVIQCLLVRSFLRSFVLVAFVRWFVRSFVHFFCLFVGWLVPSFVRFCGVRSLVVECPGLSWSVVVCRGVSWVRPNSPQNRPELYPGERGSRGGPSECLRRLRKEVPGGS